MQPLARVLLLALAATLPRGLAIAQESPAEAKPFAGSGIDFVAGPDRGKLGSIAQIEIPAGFLFADGAGTRRFLELTQNIPGGRELGLVLPSDADQGGGWFVVFEYADVGHVKDEDKDDLDAGALLETMQEGTRAANEERERRGWPTLELVGWQKPPFYDPRTNDLTWATLGRSEGGESVNWSTRRLGREGYMNVDLVMAKEQVDAIVPRFEELMRGFDFVEGQRYAEFKSGDKVAEYGLAALVAGGAGVVALKTGLLSKLWKPIAIGLALLATQAKRFFGWIGGRSKKSPE